jgi:xylose isomerase
MSAIGVPRHALITAFVSRTKDRFHEYNQDMNFDERLEVVSHLNGFSGVEIVYPYEVPDPKICKALLKKHKLQAAAINVNVKAEPEFRNGGLTSTDKAIRDKAVRFIKEAKEYAQAVGADKVTCCPLGDGYEFSFNCDYAQMWKYLVETFSEAGSHLPEIPLFVEYKPSETRGRCFLDTAAKTLCLLNDIGLDSMGVTIDYGHSKYGQENPAEVVSQVAHSRFAYYIHINDNNGKWDWDYMVASDNLLQYIEFLYYLQENGYKDFLTSDTSPTRWDIQGTFEANSRMTNKLWRLVAQLDKKELRRLLRGGDFLKTWRFIETHVFGLKD